MSSKDNEWRGGGGSGSGNTAWIGFVFFVYKEGLISRNVPQCNSDSNSGLKTPKHFLLRDSLDDF